MALKMSSKTKRLLINLLIILTLAIGTTIAIQYAKGYRPNVRDLSIQGTGLLSLTSYPKDARVMLNDRLTTVTDDKLYLTPGTYTVKIEKDGFHPWTKTIPVKSELVSSIDTRLFPLIPATSPITFYQVDNAVLNPEGTKIAYVLKNAPLSSDNGLYIYSLTGNLLGSQNMQIADQERDYSKALLVWSPDSSQLLTVFTDNTKTGERIASSYLLSTRNQNQSRAATDVTYRLPLIISEWQNQLSKINQSTLALYPPFMASLLSQKTINAYFSTDKEKVLYSPTENTTLPENTIGKSLPNINSTPETRTLTKSLYYVFDLKEGTNYQIPSVQTTTEPAKVMITTPDATPSASLDALKQIRSQTDSRFTTNASWYANHQLITSIPNGVQVTDYDNINPVTITSANIKSNLIASSPDGSKLILLTNINQKSDIFNLIAFDLK